MIEYIWVFDENYRNYVKPDGTKSLGPIYADHWRKIKVNQEAGTARSWVLANGDKVNKRQVQRGELKRKYLFSELEVEQDIWVNENRYKIEQQVSFDRDYDRLRKIKDMYGDL